MAIILTLKVMYSRSLSVQSIVRLLVHTQYASRVNVELAMAEAVYFHSGAQYIHKYMED